MTATTERTLQREVKRLAELHRKKEKVEAELRKVREVYEEQRAKVLGIMNKAGMKNAKLDSLGTVQVVHRTEYKLQDPTVFYRYVARNRAFDLLTKRINTKAVRERLEAGKKVPGIELTTLRTLRFTPVSK